MGDRVKDYQRLARIDDDGVIGFQTTKALMPVGKLQLKGLCMRTPFYLLKAASSIGIGFKVTFFTPEWKGDPPGRSNKW